MLYVTKCRRGRFGENLCQANWVINIVNIIAGVAACKNDILTQDPENCFAIMDPGTPKVARIWKLCDGRRRCQHAKSKAVTVIECNSTSSTFLTLQYVCLEKSSNLSHNSSTTTISSYIIGTNDSNVANITTTTSGGDPGYGDYTEASTYDPDMITSSFDPGLSSTTTVVDRTPMFTNLEKGEPEKVTFPKKKIKGSFYILY